MRKPPRRKTKPAKVSAPIIAAEEKVVTAEVPAHQSEAGRAEISREEYYERLAGLSVQIGRRLEIHSNSLVRGANIALAMLDISKSKDRSRKDRATAMVAVRQWLDEVSANSIPTISWPDSRH